MNLDQQTFIDPDDVGSNTSANPHIDSIVSTRYSRRGMLKTIGTASVALFSGAALTACGSDSDATTVPTTDGSAAIDNTPPAGEKLLSFSPVAKSLADKVIVPPGYTATVLYALGDPLTADTPEYNNDGTDTDFENRAGDHHDGMEFFGVNSAGKYDPNSVSRGLLAMNHEATTDSGLPSFFIHADGGKNSLPRPANEVDKELAIHGLSFVEVAIQDGKWAYNKASTLNRRVTLSTPVEISGPAKGHALLKTKYSNDGTMTRGTLNNCGSGKTPWGSYVSGEENFNQYFSRSAGDTARSSNEIKTLNRYVRDPNSASRHGWETVESQEDRFVRWDISVKGATATDDYRNEMNTMGYVVEADPVNKTKMVKKRTALGRFAHEAAAFGLTKTGSPIAVYMGDDARGEYIYKFVSDAKWSAADAKSSDVLATGDKYLDKGKLYVARFDADGSGEWIELSIENQLIINYADYDFSDQADVLVNARLAGDAVGATKMDRPEWSATHPKTGEVYFTLTNNTNRTGTSGAYPAVDSANPRIKNANGHIIRLREGLGGNNAIRFTWDIYLFAAPAATDAATVNLSGLTADRDLSSPDGLAFAQSTGLLWIQTDDGAYTGTTNCMMLAAQPGYVNDGESMVVNGKTTYIGAKPTANTLKRFLVGPKDCELTGITETPDGKALFVNIQHPGEKTAPATLADPSTYTSQWPSNAYGTTGYGLGKRPRSATIVITKDDGGRIGS